MKLVLTDAEKIEVFFEKKRKKIKNGVIWEKHYFPQKTKKKIIEDVFQYLFCIFFCKAQLKMNNLKKKSKSVNFWKSYNCYKQQTTVNIRFFEKLIVIYDISVKSECLFCEKGSLGHDVGVGTK